MNDAIRTLSIWASSGKWPDFNLRAYQHRSRLTIGRLSALDAAFQKLVIVSDSRLAAEVVELRSIDELVCKHAFDTSNVQNYLHVSPDGRLTSESLSRSGFAVSYYSYQGEDLSVLPAEKGGVYLRLRGCSAGAEPDAGATLELSPDRARSVGDLRQILRALIENWECKVAGITHRDYEATIKAKNRNSYAGQWLYYLPFPTLANCLPPDIRHEPFANGILIETTPHMPDADNPADIAAGNRVRDVLDEFGLVNDATYAIEGWPPDREESLYEQFISGAPAGRKYTVHCIDFDGYDPDRRVLLYAKLFRRLKRHPKEWGPRGWDGPVLNEAKRQVRAAAKAGGVPIEWHIGLEEPAHQVRQLLADYTDITEQQLRVVYTPLEEALARQPP